MAHIHAVLGPGGEAVPDSVIKDGLKDLLEKGDALALPWYGPPSDSLEAVYDYVLDNEVPFTMFYTGRKPPTVFETDGDLAETKDIHKALAQMASPGSKALVLFPDGDDDISETIFGYVDFAPEGVTLLDVTNGLVPIEVEGEEGPPDPHPEEVEDDRLAAETEDEDSLAGFTREELEGLGLKLLKRAASNVDPDVVIESKEQAIALILGETPSRLMYAGTVAIELVTTANSDQEEVPGSPKTYEVDGFVVGQTTPAVDVAELKKLVATMSEQLAKLEALLQ